MLYPKMDRARMVFDLGGVWDFQTAGADGWPHAWVDGNRKGLFTRGRRPKLAAHFLRKRWHGIPDFGYKG